MLNHVRPAAMLLLLFTLVTGIVYPLIVTGLVQLAIPHAANGSRITRGGSIAGSELIGQAFTREIYFHGRPSATTGPDPTDDTKTVDAPYNAGSSSGSNLGPLSRKLIERVAGDVAVLKKGGVTHIAPDAVTASASGLDPHISPAFAQSQVPRVAAARKIPQERVFAVLDKVIERPFLGIIGEPRINVLRLNLALDGELPGSTN